METEKRYPIHYAWFILAGCCALQGGSLGLLHNCAGVFYSPVCQELGFEMGQLSSYRMLYSVSLALAMPLAAKWLGRYPVRAVITAADAVMGGCALLMGMAQELWHWYAVGLIQGIASAFLCFIPAPILLSNWFHKKCGLAVGISAAFSGLVGMIGSAALGFIIPSFGWRAGYVFSGVLAIILILPFSLFVFRYRPEDMGLLPYGSGEEKEEAAEEEKSEENGKKAGLSALLRQPVFYAALGAHAASTASGCLNTFLTPCGLAAGLTMTVSAMLTSLSLFGNMASKLLLGRASDSIGAVRAFLLSAAIAMAGHALLLTGISWAIPAGALLYGVTLPVSSVMVPLFCRLYWKGDAYGEAFSYISMAGMLLSSPFNALFGRLYDMTGGYSLTILVSLGLMALAFVLVLLPGKAGKGKHVG